MYSQKNPPESLNKLPSIEETSYYSFFKNVIKLC